MAETGSMADLAHAPDLRRHAEGLLQFLERAQSCANEARYLTAVDGALDATQRLDQLWAFLDEETRWCRKLLGKLEGSTHG